MKSFILYILFAVGCIVTGASCSKDFLEITPKGYLVAGKVEDYENLLNGGGYSSGTELFIPMGDEGISVDPYYATMSIRNARLFRWEDKVYEDNEDDATSYILQDVYKLNKIINEVPDAAGGTPQLKKALKAEAMANRVWDYFVLINLYGKPYNSATAATDAGYPIVTSADVTANKFTRASVKEVYDMMVHDLTTAIPDIPETQNLKVRMCKAGAEAILGKVYMFMGNYTAALEQLNNAFAHLPGAGAPAPVSLADLKVTLADYGPWGYDPALTPMMFITGDPARQPQEEVFARTVLNYFAFIYNYVIASPETMNLFPASDMRRRFFGQGYFTGDFILPGAKRRLGPITTSQGMNLPDMYLLRAECRARENDADGAAADLLALRNNRMSAADAAIPAGMSRLQLIQFVLDERVREFAMQGYRWLDMRRLSVDPLFAGKVYTHKHVATDLSETVFTLRPERFVLRLPQKVIDQNPGMANNQ